MKKIKVLVGRSNVFRDVKHNSNKIPVLYTQQYNTTETNKQKLNANCEG